MNEMEVRFDGHCFGCGPLNMDGLRLTFEPGPEGSVADYVVPDRFQSWAGMTHGGIMALMLDEAVGWAAWHAGRPGVTGRLQVSYRRPLKLGEAVRIVGKVENIRRTLIYVSAYIESRDDHSRVADATATVMAVKTVVDPIGR
jgi:acyl-coenzyme A thioesterase PaaI-like protein